MSEEYSMSVSFKFSSVTQVDELETLLEHLELYETDEAAALLNRKKLAIAQQSIEQCVLPGSEYTNANNLLKMYLQTADSSVDDMRLSLKALGLISKIEIEGYDVEGPDCCTALVLILWAYGLSNIDASADSCFWSGHWYEDKNMQLKFESEITES